MSIERFIDIVSFMCVVGFFLLCGYSLLPHENTVLSSSEAMGRMVGFVGGALFCLVFWLFNRHPGNKETKWDGGGVGVTLVIAFTIQAVIRLLFGEMGIQVLMQFIAAFGFVGLGFLAIFLGVRWVRGDE
ncbi:MAG: hypothetical protein HC828_04315 [Blastochloris sp.]|nr:hypothetical protein [Blastochloris sp.]